MQWLQQRTYLSLGMPFPLLELLNAMLLLSGL